jgi:MtaA/CmuA family methyltransferase
MTLLELARRSKHRIAIIIGSRPGARYAGFTDREIMEDAEKKAASVLAFVERHDPDIVYSISGMASEAESLGAVVLNSENGSQAVVKRPLAESEDLDLLKSTSIGDSPLCACFLESLRLLSKKITARPVAGSIAGPLSVTGQLMGLDRMLVLSVEKPDYLKSVLRIVTERLLEYVKMQVEYGAGVFHVAEPTGSLLSPPSFRELCLPFLQAVFAGIPVPNFLHICGDTNRHLEALAETGAHVVGVDAMVDMRRAADIFGPRTGVCGNISVAGVLFSGTPKEVRGESASMLELMSGCATYIPGTSCGIGRNIPEENIRAFLDTVRNWR